MLRILREIYIVERRSVNAPMWPGAIPQASLFVPIRAFKDRTNAAKWMTAQRLNISNTRRYEYQIATYYRVENDEKITLDIPCDIPHTVCMEALPMIIIKANKEQTCCVCGQTAEYVEVTKSDAVYRNPFCYTHVSKNEPLQRFRRARANATRRARHEAYTSCGMKRVRGTMGGVYYE